MSGRCGIGVGIFGLIILIFAGIISFCAASSIAEASITCVIVDKPTINGSVLSDSGVWLLEYSGQSAYEKASGPILKVKTSSEANGTGGNVDLVLYKPDSTQSVKYGVEETADIVIPNQGIYGTYSLGARCNYGYDQLNSTLLPFTVHKLELFFESTEVQEAEVGFEAKIPVIFKKDGQIVTDKASYLVRIKDSGHTYYSSVPQYVESNGGSYVDISVKIPYDVPIGRRTIEVVGTYAGNTMTITKSIDIIAAIDIDISTESLSCRANEYCSFDLDVVVDSNGPTPLTDYSPGNLIAGIYKNNNSELIDYPSISRVDCNENTKHCIIKMMTGEKLAPGGYTLKISAVDNQLGSSAAYIGLLSSFFLEGSIKNAENNPVSAKITLASAENSQVITKDFTGEYRLEILKGRYDATMNFQGGMLIAEIYNASFENALLDSKRNINFDTFDKSELLDGVHTVRVTVLEVGFNFQSANLRIPYSSMNIYNEENLEVYRCTNWNFGMRKCNGDWTRVKGATVNAVADFVEFNTNNLSAFLLGEKKFLHFHTVGSANKEISLGGTIPVEGKILDSDGNDISGASIILKAENFSTTVTTVDDGSFLGYLTLPYKEGIFDVSVTAQKEPYIPVTSKIVVKTVRKEDLSIILPDTEVPVELDLPKIITLTVTNPGQVAINDVQVNINGLPSKNYDVVPGVVNTLAPGETKELKLTVNLTTAGCGEKCALYTSVGVEATAKSETGNALSSGGSFVIELKQPSSSSVASTATSGDGVTGMFTAITAPNLSTDTMIGVFLIISIIVVLILILKKKSRPAMGPGRVYPVNKHYGSGRFGGARGNMISSMRTIKSDIKDKK